MEQLDHKDQLRYCEQCKVAIPLTRSEWLLDSTNMVWIHIGEARWCLDSPKGICTARLRIPTKIR